MRRRNRFGLVVLAALGAAIAIYLGAYWPMLTRDPVGPPREMLPSSVEGGLEVIEGQFLGHTETDIVERFGPPSHRWEGHYGAPAIEIPRTYPDAITATYLRASGILYLSFCREGGQLVCFSSHWMPEGAVF
jgi:hypothetical protein